MKTIAYTIAAFIALAGIALAQQPAPTVQSTAEDANRAIGILQGQRNEALDQVAAARIANAKVQAELIAEKKLVEEMRAKAHTVPEPQPIPAVPETGLAK